MAADVYRDFFQRLGNVSASFPGVAGVAHSAEIDQAREVTIRLQELYPGK